MIVFVLIAAALVAIAAAAIVIPLAASRRSSTPPARWAALAVVVMLGGGGAALYAWLGNRSWMAAPAADSPQSMVGRLARRLEENPDDLSGWLLLGRSYAALEEFPLAARAYQRADQLGGGRNVEAITGLAEALVFDDQTQLTGRAGQLFERALELDPHSGKALFYGAAVAERRGDLRLAKQRFQNLLDESPPAEVRPILERQIAALDLRIAQDGRAPTDSGSPPESASPTGTTAPRAGTTAPTAGATKPAAAVRVHLTFDPRLASRAPPDAPCFVFVRTPGVPGPPLAVKRLSQSFPQTVELSAADAMIAGHGIELNEDVEVVARISVSGTPQEHAGDLFGMARVRVSGVIDVNVKIDQVAN